MTFMVIGVLREHLLVDSGKDHLGIYTVPSQFCTKDQRICHYIVNDARVAMAVAVYG